MDLTSWDYYIECEMSTSLQDFSEWNLQCSILVEVILIFSVLFNLRYNQDSQFPTALPLTDIQ